jgi:AcrR family transcriptional regulator
MSARRTVREDLLDAAERLFARAGLDGVSLREIIAEAGATNASAVQYHFGDRAGLVRAVVERHEASVDRRRHAWLDEMAGTQPELRAFTVALVQPFAAEVDEPGGVGYVQLLADLLNHPRWSAGWSQEVGGNSSYMRWRAAVEPLLSPEAVRRHRRFVALRFTVSELARRCHGPGRVDVAFVDELVDLATGLLAAPVTARAARR